MTEHIQTASHWGVYSVETDRATHEIRGVDGVSYDPHPSPIQASLPETVHGRLRIDQPYVREGYLRSTGRRGADAYVPISWEEALDLVATALLETREKHGNESIYGGSYGWASAGRLHHSPSVLKRFLAHFGGYVDKTGNHSFGAAAGIMPYVVGRSDISNLVVPWPEVVEHTKLLVMFGGAPLKNAQIDSGGAVNHENPDWYAKKTRAAGVDVVCISPYQHDVVETVAPRWIPIRPNTDTALMIGLAHTLVSERRHDLEFLHEHCEGFPEFERYLLGHDASWASRITGVPEETIIDLARQMASTRTLVNTAWAVQRADHGEQPVWMTVALAAVLGQIGLPGGGFSLGLGAVSGIALPRTTGIPRPKLPLDSNPVKATVPVARVTDLLLHPGEEIEHNGRVITFPDIELIYSAGGKPFFTTTPT
ncbi:molybdopterin-dependent oxidoreductase [Fodinicola feengrottensis]|uniref:molybdopterin-dependent oxidoreductase n=1 Tax=Fodinicola feengrottensis TaxID=435914 RepID=UPI002441568A|nr:molybdopterin-dependent oxidoreductase [Fodinicola feengrottensis]